MVIAAYNAGSTLSAALASVAAQTSPPGAVVVVDDGSSDATGELAKAWSDRLPLRLVTHPANMGLAQARRSGIEASTQPLLAILDADDVWLPDHLGLMRRTYEQHPGIVTADALKWMAGKGVSRDTHREVRPIPDASRQRTQILEANFVFIGVLFARDAYLAAGGFSDGLLGAEDWDLWIRMIRAGLTVTGTPYPTVLYRIHGGALSRGEQQLENEAKVLQGVIGGLSEPEDLRAAKRGLRGLRARLSLVRAYEHARIGDMGAARRAAFGALVGPRAVAIRAAAMICAPGPSVRFRDRAFWWPTVRLGR